MCILVDKIEITSEHIKDKDASLHTYFSFMT